MKTKYQYKNPCTTHRFTVELHSGLCDIVSVMTYHNRTAEEAKGFAMATGKYKSAALSGTYPNHVDYTGGLWMDKYPS